MTGKEIRKEVFIYASVREQFTQKQLKEEMSLDTKISNAVAIKISHFLKEMVSWGYLTAINEKRTVRYYRI